MRESAVALLRAWLTLRLSEADRDWLERQIAALATDRSDRSLAVAIGSVPRRLGNGLLALSATELAAADSCLEGWSPGAWSLADAARILLLASLPADDFARRFRALSQTADVAEAIALYRGLPLYPEPAALEAAVAEGLRGNMRPVFEAIAQHNPYPRMYFDIHRWNHMVLKALFIGSSLAPIQGLDARANAELARIMLDFARERQAAGRAVPDELWRCVFPFEHAQFARRTTP